MRAEGDPETRNLLAPGPFEDRPPRWIRARLYLYRFTRLGEAAWWRRTLVDEYLPPLSTDSFPAAAPRPETQDPGGPSPGDGA